MVRHFLCISFLKTIEIANNFSLSFSSHRVNFVPFGVKQQFYANPCLYEQTISLNLYESFIRRSFVKSLPCEYKLMAPSIRNCWNSKQYILIKAHWSPVLIWVQVCYNCTDLIKFYSTMKNQPHKSFRIICSIRSR